MGRNDENSPTGDIRLTCFSFDGIIASMNANVLMHEAHFVRSTIRMTPQLQNFCYLL
jgi:hypothetical protein